MAICPDCRQDVQEAATMSCTLSHFLMGNKAVPRVRYGDERRPPVEYSYTEVCDDCGVGMGGYHHRGCAVEQCPLCGDYAAVCYCWSHLR